MFYTPLHLAGRYHYYTLEPFKLLLEYGAFLSLDTKVDIEPYTTPRGEWIRNKGDPAEFDRIVLEIQEKLEIRKIDKAVALKEAIKTAKLPMIPGWLIKEIMEFDGGFLGQSKWPKYKKWLKQKSKSQSALEDIGSLFEEPVSEEIKASEEEVLTYRAGQKTSDSKDNKEADVIEEDESTSEGQNDSEEQRQNNDTHFIESALSLLQYNFTTDSKSLDFQINVSLPIFEEEALILYFEEKANALEVLEEFRLRDDLMLAASKYMMADVFTAEAAL